MSALNIAPCITHCMKARFGDGYLSVLKACSVTARWATNGPTSKRTS